MEGYKTAILMSAVAGGGAAIGGLIGISFKKIKKETLSLVLGFSAGVMIAVSLLDMLFEAQSVLSKRLGTFFGTLAALQIILAGILAVKLIETFIPERMEVSEEKRLLKISLISAGAIVLHNFPEGVATFAAGYHDQALGLSIMLAIMLHNIPEGLAVSVPLYYIYKKRAKAFIYAGLSGLAEPVGAVLAFLMLRPVMSETVVGIMLGGVAGIMLYISFSNLLAESFRQSGGNKTVLGVISGMLVMAFTHFII